MEALLGSVASGPMSEAPALKHKPHVSPDAKASRGPVERTASVRNTGQREDDELRSGGCTDRTIQLLSSKLLEGKLDVVVHEETVDELWEVTAGVFNPDCGCEPHNP